jgi:iron(III) transport system permease protein
MSNSQSPTAAVVLAVDTRTWSLVLNTLLLSGATCAISLPLGSVLAWLLMRTDLPGRRAGMLLLGLMLFVPLYVQAAAWHAGFGVQGWFTRVVSLPGGLEQWTLLEGWRAAIWVHSMAAVPWVALIVGLGLGLVEPELEELALLDGSPRQVFFRVTLRSAVPAVGVAALWVALVTAGEMTVTDLFQVRSYAEELFTRLSVGQTPREAVAGMSPGLGLSAALVVAALWVCTRLLPQRRPLSLRRRWVFRLGAWRAPLGLLVGLVLLLLIGVPLVNLCYQAGIVITPAGSGWTRTWSLQDCGKMLILCLVEYRREFGWSLGIGALAASAAVVAATALAWPARRGGLQALPALATVAAGLALPGPVVGLAIVWLFNFPDSRLLFWLYDQPIPAFWMALTLRALPLATLIIWHALRSVPTELLDSAAVDGASPLRRLWSVALPCRLSAAALAWVVALAVALGDLGASFLVMPPGVETLSTTIFGKLHAGQESAVAGICLGLFVLFAIVAWLAVRLAARRGRGVATEE